MPSSSKIIELRELLASKFPSAPHKPSGRLPTYVAQVDALLQGGLALGAMTEIVCRTGGGLMFTALVRATLRRRGLLALIDGADSFDLTGVPAAALARLLWVRSQTAAQAVQAADLLLRDANLNLVVLDLRSTSPEQAKKIPASSWYRLQRIVEPTATAFVALTRQPLLSGARPRLVLEASFSLTAFDCRQEDLLGHLHVQFLRGQEERPRQIA